MNALRCVLARSSRRTMSGSSCLHPRRRALSRARRPFPGLPHPISTVGTAQPGPTISWRSISMPCRMGILSGVARNARREAGHRSRGQQAAVGVCGASTSQTTTLGCSLSRLAVPCSGRHDDQDAAGFQVLGSFPLKRFGPFATNQVLKSALDRTNQCLRRNRRFRAHEELAHPLVGQTMLQHAHTVRLGGCL